MNAYDEIKKEIEIIIYNNTKNNDEAKDVYDIINKPNIIQKIGNNITLISIPTWMLATLGTADKGPICLAIMAGGGLIILGEMGLLSKYNEHKAKETLKNIKDILKDYKESKNLKRELKLN